MNRDLFQFANPDYLYGLLLVPFFLVLFIGFMIYKRKAMIRYGDPGLVQKITPEYSVARLVFKFILYQFALISMIIALARPQFGSKLQEVKRKGIELMIALDVSNSMMAEDVQPNRLERAKQIIIRLIDNLKSDKVGLVVFAGQSYIQLPITIDFAAAKMFLEAVDPNAMPRQGTAIGSAIDLSLKSFDFKNAEQGKALVIISDGENHEDDAIGSAQKALQAGVHIYTVGIGSPQGAPLPIKTKYGVAGYQTDKQGNIVVSKLNETMLQQIASAGDGVYIRAGMSNAGIKNLVDEINKLTKSEIDARVYAEYDERFQYFAALSLILILIDLLIMERRNRYLRNFSLFTEGEGLLSKGIK